MDKHNWTDDIKSRITYFECDAPKGLWEGINDAISEKPEITTGRFKWWWAAGMAALASLAIVFFIFKPYSSNTEGLTASTSTNVLAKVSTDTTTNIKTNEIASATATMDIESNLNTEGRANTETRYSIDDNYSASAETNINSADYANTDVGRTELLADAAPSAQQTNSSPTQPNATIIQIGDAQEQTSDTIEQKENLESSIDINDWEKAEMPQNWERKTRRLAFNIYGSGSAGKENSTINRSSVAASLGANGADWLGDPRIGIELYNQGYDTKATEKHYTPVRAGFGLSYGLNKHLSLDTGLELALLYSEFTDGTEQNHTCLSQRLRYIGLPIDLRWNFLSNKDLNIYAKCGVLAQKCIYGSTQESFILSGSTSKGQTNRRSELPWQFSAQTGVGAEYRIWRKAGLYAEFDAGYYFDDACNLKNIYQSRPFSASFNIGIRVDISRTW